MNLRNITIKGKSVYTNRKKFHKFAKSHFDQLFKIFINVYLKKYSDIDDKYLKLIAFQSIEFISSALSYYPHLNFKKNLNVLEISSSNHDLIESSHDLKILENLNVLSKREVLDFNFEKKIRYSKAKINNLNIITKIFVRAVGLLPVREKILTDLINFKLYFKMIKKGVKPIFLDPSDFNTKLDLTFDKNLRSILFEEAKKIFLNNKNEYNNLNLFDIFALFSILPISIVENFLNLKKNSKIKRDNIYKKILVSQVRSRKEEVNFWIAGIIFKNKIPLEIVQHGAGYYVCDYVPQYNNILDISDKYYCWAKKNSSKIEQYSVTRTFEKKIKNKKYDLLIIPNDWSYLYSIKSAPFGDLIDKNRNENINFIKNIKFTNNYIIKKPPNIYDGYDEILKKNNLDHKITNNDLKKLVPKSKICVCSYLGSSFFELMANDIPFVTFFKFSENSLNAEFIHDIKKLKKFNFLFYNGTSAARFLNENHDKFIDLWNDEEFSKFRHKFRDNWCKKENNWQEIFIKNIS